MYNLEPDIKDLVVFSNIKSLNLNKTSLDFNNGISLYNTQPIHLHLGFPKFLSAELLYEISLNFKILKK